jgi:[NiFe] hydrogenase large subunit
VLVAYGKGHKDIKPLVDSTLQKLGDPAGALFSTLGRTAARGLETIAIGAMMGLGHGTAGKHQKRRHQDLRTLGNARQRHGRGLNDVPVGRSGPLDQHRRTARSNYQYVVPSTWNFGPRDAKGKLGPVEEALIGTPVPIPSSRWKSCVPSTPLIRASPAASM